MSESLKRFSDSIHDDHVRCWRELPFRCDMVKSHRVITGCRQLCANSTLEIVAMQRKPTSANPSFLSYRPRDATAAAPQKAEMGLTSPKGQEPKFISGNDAHRFAGRSPLSFPPRRFSMERRLAAVLLTDMVGNSRLMGLDAEGTIARQRTHRDEIFDPKLSAHGGRIVKTTGDGLLVEFASAVDAVKCAIEVQQAMADLETDVAHDRRIQYRIGINLGDIVVDGDDILGDGVNVAARLESLAKPGGICISGNVHDQLAGKVNIGFDDGGSRR
jgi:class 3 adenylate cyclase